MSIGLYDNALAEKIKCWIKDPNLKILKPDEMTRLLQIKADQNKDKSIKLPLIGLSRLSDLEILNVSKRPLTFDGMTYEANQSKSMQINAIPIRIQYQLDIYTRFFAEGDEYLRNFIFNLINYPEFKITIPYNNFMKEYKAHITVNPTISDNSDIPQKLFPDQFTRFTIQFSIEDAYLFSIPVVENVEMEEKNIIEII